MLCKGSPEKLCDGVDRESDAGKVGWRDSEDNTGGEDGCLAGRAGGC